jgi:helix-turn-helix protein/transposase
MQQRRFTKEFEEGAVRLMQTSGRTQREIAGDLGIGLSTLVRWIERSRDRRAAAESDVTAGLKRCAGDPPPGAGYPEKGHRFFRPGGKSMRFGLIDRAKAEFPIHRLCRVLGVSQSGYFAWKGRPACRRQRDDMVLLAHVRSAFALSNGTYGSPRMTQELRDSGLTVGRRRTARLMRQNGLRARQKRRFKRTTRQPPRLAGRPEPARSGLHGNRARREMGRRHLLRLDPRRLAVPSRRR